jgi:hypothetical protein
MSSGRLILGAFDTAMFNGRPVAGATLTVFENFTTTLAPLWQNRAMTVAAKNAEPGNTANGQVSNAQGRWQEQSQSLWLDATKEYTVVIQYPAAAGGGTFTINDVAPSIDALEVEALAEATATAAVVGPVADATAAAAAAATSAATAVAAASVVNGYFPAALSNVPRGVVSAAITAAGSGGTNGTFALAFSGGNLSVQPTGTFTVSGGAVTAVSITGAGLYVGASISLPTVSLAASSGLTGATVTIAADFLIQSGRSYWTDHASDSTLLQAVQNAAGTATALSGVTVARNVSALTADMTRANIDLGYPVASTALTPSSGSVSPTQFVAVSFTSATVYVWEVWAGVNSTVRYAQALNNQGGGINQMLDTQTGTVSEGPGGFANTATSVVDRIGAYWRWRMTWTPNASTSANWQIRPTGTGALPYSANGTDSLMILSSTLTTGGGPNLFPNSTMQGGGWTRTSLTATAATPAVVEANLLRTRFNITATESATTAQRVNGTMTGTRATEASGSGLFVRAFRSVSIPSGNTFRFQFQAKAGERTIIKSFSMNGIAHDATFNLATGAASGTGASMTALDNGWWECVCEGTSTNSAADNWQVQITNAAGQWPYDGNGTSGLFLHRARVTNTTWTSGWTLTSVSMTPNATLFGGIPVGAGGTGSTAHPLAGKKVAVLGTSLVEQAIWTTAFAALTGCTIINLGVSGQAYGGTPGSITAQMTTTNIPSDTAMIIADMPVNDMLLNVPLGVVSDTATSTFAGAMANVSIWARANRPNAQMVYVQCTSADPTYATHRHGITNGLGLTLTQYQTMLADVAAREGRVIIDPNAAGMSWRDMAARWTGDGLHWNTAGGALIAAIYSDAIRAAARTGWLAL